MEGQELERLAADLESDRVERKSSAGDMDPLRRAICALANDLPDHRTAGVLLVGLDDRGSCASLAIDDQLLTRLADVRSDGLLLPFPVITVQRREVAGCDVVVICVEAAEAPPIRYRGRVYVRVGPSTRLASPEEERRLAERRRSRDLPYDIRPVPSASLEDLDLDLFVQMYLPAALSADVLEQNQRSTYQQLASLRFATSGGSPAPTVLGLVVAAFDPRRFVPGSYIQFLRIDGTGLSDPIRDQKEIDGPLPELLRTLDEVLQAHVSVASDATSSTIEIRQPDYPIVALQQLSRNAVMHRNYEATNAPVRITWFNDRIELQNPGGPFGQVTRSNFGQPGVTDYRNPHLAEAMKNLGYVQRFGLGIPIARRELERNGNPLPEFHPEDAHTLVILRRR